MRRSVTSHDYVAFFATLLLAAGITLLGFSATQTAFTKIALGYGLAFIGYFTILQSFSPLGEMSARNGPVQYGPVWVWEGQRGNTSNPEPQTSPLKYYLALAILLRVLLLFAFPTLSDDIYRFIWDGRLLNHGLNPFDHLPAYYLEAGHEVPGLSTSLFQELNSPEYYTIYPPLAQAVFWVSCYLCPESIYGSAMLMKLFLLGCELGSIWLLIKLLAHWKMPAHRVLWYALNPLILVEIMGNLHFEGAMVFFLLLGFWLLVKSRWLYAATAIALSIASKLLPLLFLPFLLRRLRFPKAWLLFFFSLGIILILLFLPLINGVFLENIGQSLDLYFRKFEFNASFYYLFRAMGYWWKGYNLIALIGPILAMSVAVIVFARALLERPPPNWDHLPGLCLFAITVYLFSATTVHPWYLSLPIVLCCFTQWRYPLLWSALIVWTYIHYSNAAFQENYAVIVLEYGLVVGFLIWEVYQKYSKKLVVNKE